MRFCILEGWYHLATVSVVHASRASTEKEGSMSGRVQRSQAIRVLIADAFPIVRTGLVATIEAGAYMEVVGSAACRDDLKAQLQATAADVLIVNLVEMGDAPAALLREIKQAYQRLGIVVFATTVDFAPELLAAGASAYISYAEPDEHLHLAIRAAHARQTYLSPLAEECMDRWAGLATKTRLVTRELQIIRLMAQGMDVEEIARHLDLNHWTIRNYVSRIRKKTGWTTWPQMVSWYHTMYGSGNTQNVHQRST